MSKLNNNLFLEINNNTSYIIDETNIIKSFRGLERNGLIVHRQRIEDRFSSGLIISLVIIDNKEIRSINKKYRNKDKVTDVLSFEFLVSDGFVTPNNRELLGEIFISYSEVIRKSKKNSTSLEKEFLLLFIHGLLHLLGHDHKNKLEKKEFKKLEKIFFKKTNVFFKPNQNYKKL